MTALFRKQKRDFKNKQLPWQVWVSLAVFLGIIAWLITAQVGKSQANHRLAQTREQIAARIQGDLSLALSAYDELDQKNSSGQTQTLSTVRQHMYAAYILDGILAETYGDEYSLFENESYYQIEYTLDEYSKQLALGHSGNDVKSSLAGHMNQVASTLNNRFGVNGLLPKTALNSNTP